MRAVQLTGGAAGFCQKFSKVCPIILTYYVKKYFSEFAPPRTSRPCPTCSLGEILKSQCPVNLNFSPPHATHCQTADNTEHMREERYSTRVHGALGEGDHLQENTFYTYKSTCMYTF